MEDGASSIQWRLIKIQWRLEIWWRYMKSLH